MIVLHPTRTVLLASFLIAALTAACQVPDNPVPLSEIHTRSDLLAAYRQGIPDRFLKEELTDILTADGLVYGTTSQHLRRSSSLGLRPGLDSITLVSEVSERESSTRIEHVFEAAPDFEFKRMEVTMNTSAGEYRLIVNRQGEEIVLKETAPNGDETHKRRPTRSFTLIDALASDLWLASSPAPGSRITVRDLNVETGEVVDVELEAVDPDTDTQGLSDREYSYAIRENSRMGETIHAYDSKRRILFSLTPDGLELRSNRSGSQQTRLESGVKYEQANYLLPHEIEPELPILRTVRPATTKVCMADSCGTGVIVSNAGHILTAAHVVGREPGAIALPGFGGTRVVDRVIPLGGGTKDAVILETAPASNSPTVVDTFRCLPLSRASHGPETEAWALGFGEPTSTPARFDSDGLHLTVLPARLLSADGSEFRETAWTNPGSIRVLSPGAVAGYSGGPVIDAEGRLLGITLARNSTVTASGESLGIAPPSGAGGQTVVFRAGAIHEAFEKEFGSMFVDEAFNCLPGGPAPAARPEERISGGNVTFESLIGDADSAALNRLLAGFRDTLADDLRRAFPDNPVPAELVDRAFAQLSLEGLYRIRPGAVGLIMSANDLYPGIPSELGVLDPALQIAEEIVVKEFLKAIQLEALELSPVERVTVVAAVDIAGRRIRARAIKAIAPRPD